MEIEESASNLKKPVVVPEEDDLEEGEISSDSNDEEVKNGSSPTHLLEDYELNERPCSLSHNLQKQQSLAQSNYRPIARPSRPPPPGVSTFKPLNEKYSDDEDCLRRSSSDEDSDEGMAGGKKSRYMPGHNRTLVSTKAPAPWLSTTSHTSSPMGVDANEAFKSQAAAFQQKRKVNDIWSKVLQDEEVSDIFGKVVVKDKTPRDLQIDRGSESYCIQLQEPQQTAGVLRSDSSDLSSGGLTDNEIKILKAVEMKSKRGRAVNKKLVVDEELPKNFGSRKRKYQAKTSKLRNRKKQKQKIINRLKRKNPEFLAKYMAGKLNEPKHTLLERTIRLIGRNPCISIFLKTMKIERRGGLMIKNQQRRRTPGGTYLYLIRGDPRLPYSIVSQVFDPEKVNKTKQKKSKSARKRLKQKALLEAQTLKTGGENKVTEQVEGFIQVNQVKMDEDSEKESLPNNQESDDDVDSDDYYGLKIDESAPINFENNEDCIDIHCDASDLSLA